MEMNYHRLHEQPSNSHENVSGLIQPIMYTTFKRIKLEDPIAQVLKLCKFASKRQKLINQDFLAQFVKKLCPHIYEHNPNKLVRYITVSNSENISQVHVHTTAKRVELEGPTGSGFEAIFTSLNTWVTLTVIIFVLFSNYNQ